MFKWQAIDKTNRDVPRLRDKGRLKGAEEEGGEGGGIANTKTKEVLPEKSLCLFPFSFFAATFSLKLATKEKIPTEKLTKLFVLYET